ncbi:hypothetical protein, partial [Mesorhizobium sp.]|uniref:hypothetical protein n=1 Tax=Mesorhizobium sp. TaxID=1871066 RepID=UPI0025C0359F
MFQPILVRNAGRECFGGGNSAGNLPFRHVASLALVVAASLPAALPPVHYADHFRIPTRPLMTAAL